MGLSSGVHTDAQTGAVQVPMQLRRSLSGMRKLRSEWMHAEEDLQPIQHRPTSREVLEEADEKRTRIELCTLQVRMPWNPMMRLDKS